MPSKAAFMALLAAVPALAAAARVQDSTFPINSRAIETSATDSGQWVPAQPTPACIRFLNAERFKTDDLSDEELGTLEWLQRTEPIKLKAVDYPKGALHVEEGNRLLERVGVDGPKSWLKTFSDFHTRDSGAENGSEVSNWLFEQAKQLSSTNPAITVKQFTHGASDENNLFKWLPINQSSIIAQLPGKSAKLVVVGAHLDSKADDAKARTPGADDNGSGTVVLLEALRVLAESGIKPKNTIEIHWYAGEEFHQLGSKHVWASYKAARKNVIAYLNQDMVGYSASGKPAVFQDFVDGPLTQYVTALVEEYLNMVPSTSECGYACSDHASAHCVGFPAAFVAEDVFEKLNPNRHTGNDTYDGIMWPTILLHSKLVASYLLEASYI